MKGLARILAPLALVATIGAPILFLMKIIGLEPMKAIMLGATVAWFVAAPFWLEGAEE